MLPTLGKDVVYQGKVYHVQDRNVLSQQVKIGIPDTNNLIWNTFWVDFKEVSEVPEQITISKEKYEELLKFQQYLVQYTTVLEVPCCYT